MSDDLYSNLLRATDNTSDITTEKQGTITKIQDKLCNVKEEDTGLEHTNVPVINEVQVKEGDTVLLGFLDNNIYTPVVYGVIGREIKATIDVDNELSSTSENPVQNKTITSALNDKANNNHSHTSVEVVEGTALTHIGTGAEASQQEVNIAVDSKVDDLNRNVNSLQSEVGSLSDSITNKVDTVYATDVTVNSNLKFTRSPAIRYRRVGKVVTLRLWATQASPTSTGWINIASIPTGYKPIEDVVIAMQVGNNTHITQARTINRGTVQCFVSSAGTEYVGLTATWFTNDDYPSQ